nr:hypothetical protein [Streptomyces sp. SM14]
MAAADPDSVGRHQGLPEPTARQRRPDPPLDGSPTRPNEPPTYARPAHRSWGPYAAAIARWETLTRPAPPPAEDGRLSPAFVEWMQGLPDGWVTATPGLGRPAQLTALGNGVVPQQAARAVDLLAPPLSGCPHQPTP